MNVPVTSELLPSEVRLLQPDCAADGILLNETFTTVASIDSSSAFPSLGSSIGYFTTTEGESFVRVKDRTDTRHGIEIDLKGVKSCLVSGETYLLTARVRLNKPGAAQGSLTDCATVGENCLVVKSECMSAQRQIFENEKYTELQSFQTTYGDWLTVSSEFAFWNNEMESDNVYHTLRFEGVAEGVDIEIDNIVLRSPPIFSQPLGVCEDLVPGNNGADEVGDSPYPFYSNLEPVNVGINEENGNMYFAVTGRKFAYYDDEHEEDYHWTSMTFDFPVSCVDTGTTYR